ncbi:MAG: hypothetical protein Q9222_003885 [Ikaeria aurantiellina]
MVPKSALLVVDMQEDFCPPVSSPSSPTISYPLIRQSGTLAVPGARSLAPHINHLLSLPFHLKIATRDFHPPKHISFSTSHPPPHNIPFTSSTTIKNPSLPSKSREIPLWPAHCVQGTPGAEIINEIDKGKFDTVVDKGTEEGMESFSAFGDVFGNKTKMKLGEGEVEGDVKGDSMGGYLRWEGIEKVFLVGVAGDVCVKCTAMDARKEGFECFVIEEGVQSISAEGWEKAKREMEGIGIQFVGLEGEEVKSVGPSK